jgi:6-phosphofructokinase 1
MGHKVGWLALGAGIAGGADVILLPEIPYDEQVVADAILRRTREGKKFSIVVVAEGAMSTSMAKVLEEKGGKDKVEEMLKTRTPQLAAHLERLTGREARVTILGYVQRGGTPTPYDRLLSTSLGSRCAQEIMKDKWGNMMAVQNNQIVTVPLEKVAGPIKYIPKDHYLLTCVKDIGVCLGS